MAPDDTVMRTRQVLASPRRVELLELLRRGRAAISVVEAADAMGLHPNTARIHLEQLAEVGLVEPVIERPRGPGRPRTLYQATHQAPADARADGGGYRALAMLLADGLAETDDPSGAAVAAGERWVEAAAGHEWPVGAVTTEDAAAELVGLLDGLGFAPEPDLEHEAVHLHRCPFAEVARDHRTVVCGIHLGMVHRTLERMDSPLRATALEPFVAEEPLLCTIHLSTEPPDEQTGGTPLPVLVTHAQPTRRRNA